MHQNEVSLVFKGSTGAILPTRAFNEIWAGPLTKQQSAALAVQIERQTEALKA